MSYNDICWHMTRQQVAPIIISEVNAGFSLDNRWVGVYRSSKQLSMLPKQDGAKSKHDSDIR